MAQTVRLEREDGLATLTIERAEAMNALDVSTKVALRDAVREVAADPAVRAVLLTGAGDRAFCVGQDLREHTAHLADRSDVPFRTVTEHYNPLVEALATMPKPTVAAVNGVAAGAGFGLALACDFRLVAESAGFNTSFAGVALTCDSGISYTLPRIVGRAAALELLMRPRTVRAAEALSLGLATRVLPAGELRSAARDLARELAQGPTFAYAAIKESVSYGMTHDLAATLAREGELQNEAGGTDDHREAVDAFLGKRTPSFTGH